MQVSTTLWRIIVFSSASIGFEITSAPNRVGPRAVIPTASGQIGINPVIEDLGEPSSYIGEIGADTEYLSMDGGSTKWVNQNAGYLTIQTVQYTINNEPETTVTTIQIAVETATAATNGQTVGDISVVLPEALADSLNNAANAAVSSCNALKVRKRQSDAALSCLLNAAQAASKDGGIFDAVATSEWEAFILPLAENAPQLLAAALQIAVNQAVKNKLILFMAAVTIAVSQMPEVGKINIPKIGFGAPISSTASLTTATGAASATSSAACAASGSPDESSPLCTDDDCQGTNNATCTVAPNTGCACLVLAPDPDSQYLDMGYFSAQQSLIAAIATMPDPTSSTTSIFSSSSATSSSSSTTSSGPTSTIAIIPTGTGVNCLQNQPAGANQMDCLSMLFSGGFTAGQICTNTPGACQESGKSYCKASGAKCDPNGDGFIDISNYCQIASYGTCAFVIANVESSFGGNFPGSSCISYADYSQYIRGAANGCPGNANIAMQFSSAQSTGAYCLISKDDPGVCGA